MSTKPIRAGLMAAFVAAAMPYAMAQPGANSGKTAPNALQGFQQNRGQPVSIEAASLEVRDKDKVATFTGNVKVVQGDTTMRCKSLVVFYEQSGQGGQAAPAAAQTMKAAAPGPGGSSQISRLEARGGVTVVQKDQTATGDSALFDMKSNTVTLQGNVIVSQGPNVMRGERLVVDLTTGVSRVDAGKSNGPVRMLIQQGAPQANGAPGSMPKFGPQRPPSSNSTN
jgi:lipopolysaccharide export system protein LptA